jgi:hypothetical protein
MPWTTTAVVSTRTGKAVTTAQLAMAQGVLEAYLGIDETDSAAWLKARDLRTLARATEYQAAYVAEHPDLFTNMDVVAISQPDLQVTFRQGGASTPPPWLAPMAAMALRHFSKAGPRSVQLESELTDPSGADDDDGTGPGAWDPI